MFNGLRVLSIGALLLWAGATSAQSGAISYQGRLDNGGVPFNGNVNLQFRLLDQLEPGTGIQQGCTVTVENVPVEQGLFQVSLDFCDGFIQSNGADRFLETSVNDIVLAPRQPVTPAPLALRALSVAAGVPGASPFIRDANTGNIEYRFGDQVFRFQPATDPDTTFSTGESPRVTLGHANNRAEQFGDTVSGGGVSANPNVASGGMSTIGGGQGNTASGFGNTIGGGSGNATTASFSTVSGGSFNIANASNSTVGGGQGNRASNQWSFIGGGRNNAASALFSTIGGGENNEIDPNADHANISGGQSNVVSNDVGAVGGGSRNTAGGLASTVGGGTDNRASSSWSSIGGGDDNTASGSWSTVAGGRNNCAGGQYSWAGGRRAKVRPGSGSGGGGTGCASVLGSGTVEGDNGTFVWADSQDADFVSSGPNQFLVRARGGMGLNTNAPDAELHVLGPSRAISNDFWQIIAEGSETTGAAGTGAGISFLGHDGGTTRRLWGYIESVKENSTVGDTRSRMRFYTRGLSGLPVERFRIESDGVTRNTTGVWSTLSDGRLKSDIGEIPDALDRLIRLRGVRFHYTDPEQAMGADGPRMGFLAEEVEQVFPEWVGYNEDGYRFLSLTGFEAVVVEALRILQERNAAAIEIRDRQIASLEAGLAEMAAGHHDLRQAIEHQEIQSAQMQELAERNAALENRLAILEEMMLVGRRLAENP